jgi:hypothetical protein
MPSCPNGAHPTPGAEDFQVWVDRLQLPVDIISLLTGSAPLAWAGIAMSLVDVSAMCAENPDPPEPFTALDLVAEASSIIAPGLSDNQAVIEKAYRWLRYIQFRQYCVCNVVTTTPGNNCTAAPASFPLGSLGSLAGPFPVTLDQSVISSWPVQPDGSWVWGYQSSATVSGAATTGANLLIQFQAVNGAWVDGPTIQTANTNSSSCSYPIYQPSVPRIGTSSAVRIRNDAGGTYTISNFNWCFCPSVPVMPVLPVQPPIPTVPTAPVLTCTDGDICAMLTQLNHRLSVLAGQVSDLQAAQIGTDVLQELSRITLNQEGQATVAMGTRAVSVELTSLGDEAFTSALGNPRGLMRVGSLRWFDGVGYSPRRFIDADRYDETRPPGALAVSWQLLPGTTGILKFLG